MSDKYGRERLLIIDGELAEEEQKQEIQYQLLYICVEEYFKRYSLEN